MRILLLSLNWVEYLIEMANALAARGHRVEVIFKEERVRETVGAELPSLLRPGVNFHLVDDRPRGLRDPRQLATVARLVRLIRAARPDVISLHEATNTYLPFSLRVATRAPIVLTVHDVTLHPGYDAVEPGRRDRVRRYFRKRAAAVILHGERLRAQYLAQPGRFCRNAYAIPHGCYTVLRHWAKNGVPEVPYSALLFGRIHQYKGLSHLLEAAQTIVRKIPNFKLIVAGEGSDLDGRAAALRQNSYCVVHRGYLPNERVAEIFQQAAVVVLPYIEGSQSGVLRIAYAFGKPVVATAVGSIPESVEHGKTGLIVPPGDSPALASALVDLLSDASRRRAMSRAATQRAAGEMSWKTVAPETERVFRLATECGQGNQPYPACAAS